MTTPSIRWGAVCLLLATPLAALCQDSSAMLWRVASPIASEPASPSDSRNDPGQHDLRQASEFRWTYQAESRDPFAERIARLEAQVAELARQLKSGSSPATAPRVYSTAQVPTAIRYAAPAHLAPATLQRSATRVATSSGEPIVIHLHIHVDSGAAPARAVLAAPRVPVPPAARVPLRATPATPIAPAVPGIPGVSATPAAAPRSAAAGAWDDPPGAD